MTCEGLTTWTFRDVDLPREDKRDDDEDSGEEFDSDDENDVAEQNALNSKKLPDSMKTTLISTTTGKSVTYSLRIPRSYRHKCFKVVLFQRMPLFLTLNKFRTSIRQLRL